MSKNINVAKLESFFLEDEQIRKDENFMDIFTIEETKISGSSIALQKKIAREMGKKIWLKLRLDLLMHFSF